MTQHITAIYEHGVLKPLEPLDLRDQDLVSILVEKVPPNGPELDRREPTLFELFDEVGLVGIVTDAPPDLSTNPSYMEGFGKSGE